MLSSIVFFEYLALIALWFIAGTEGPGQIVSAETRTGGKGGTRYSIRHRYTVDGLSQTDTEDISKSAYERFTLASTLPIEGRPVVVRYYYLMGPVHYSELRDVEPRYGWTLFLLLWGVYWPGVISMFFYATWLGPLRLKSLYRFGEPTLGIVTSKRMRRGNPTRHFVSFCFVDAASGQSVDKEILVTEKADWEKITNGQEVTVIYWPTNPNRSALYEFGVYYVDHALPPKATAGS